jgi:hypothetical protein
MEANCGLFITVTVTVSLGAGYALQWIRSVVSVYWAIASSSNLSAQLPHVLSTFRNIDSEPLSPPPMV